MSTKVKGEVIKEGSIPLSALASGSVLLKNMDKGNPYFYLTEDNVYYDSPYGNVVYLSTDKYPGVLELVKYNKVLLTNGPTSEVIWDDNGIKIDGNASYYNIGILFSANPIVPVAETPDWNAQEGEAGYIENKPFRTIKSNDGQITNINSYFIFTEDEYYPISYLYIKYHNKTILLAREKHILFWGDGISFDIDNNYFYLGDDGNSNIIITNDSGDEFELIIALRSEFIPDTVLKTTTQTLSDEEKNQVKQNIGIKTDYEIYLDTINDFGLAPEDILFSTERAYNTYIAAKSTFGYRYKDYNFYIPSSTGEWVDFENYFGSRREAWAYLVPVIDGMNDKVEELTYESTLFFTTREPEGELIYIYVNFNDETILIET